MKINGVNRVANIYQQNTISKVNKVGKKNQKDSVEFSTVAKDFKIARDMGKKIPDVRQDKVNEIKERIATNTYNIDGKEVAKKMIESGFDFRV